MADQLPPLDFLLEASLISLQDLELAALNRSANPLRDVEKGGIQVVPFGHGFAITGEHL